MGRTLDVQDMGERKAFSLIELLVVIAIIGILAAIIFPVYSRAKWSAYRSSDMSNMNELRTALQLYKTDNDAYPPRLLGYVTLYQTGPEAGNVIPANSLAGALYPRTIQSVDTFRPALLRGADENPTSITTAVWPTNDTIGGSDTSSAQRFGPADGPVTILPAGGLYAGTGTPAEFYSMSGYDTAAVKDTTSASGFRRELRYSLFWSGLGLTTGSSSDDPHQLGYANPPSNTVVTWDTYFIDSYNSDGSPAGGSKEGIVLFLSGAARPFDANILYHNAWNTYNYIK